MPLDPMIANPATIKIANPLETYGDFLKNAYLQSEIKKANIAANQNALLNKAWQQPGAIDQDGNANWGIPVNYLAANGGGAALPQLAMDRYTANAKQQEAAKNQAEAQNFQATTAKSKAETIGKLIDNMHQDLSKISPNPQSGFGQYVDVAKNYYTHPEVSEYLKASGMTPLQAFQQDIDQAKQAVIEGRWPDHIAQMQMGIKDAAQMHENQYIDVNTGGAHNIVAAPKYGTPGAQSVGQLQTTLNPAERLEKNKIQYTQLHNGATTSLLGLPEYAGGPAPTVVTSTQMQLTPEQRAQLDPAVASAKAGAVSLTNDVTKDFMNQHTAALNLVPTVKHIDDALGLIVPGKALTGAGQTYRLDMRRVADLFGLDPTVADTQVLNKKLNEFVLDQLQHGVSSGRTTNMITKLVQDSNATGQMDPNAIREVLLSKRKDLQAQMQRHNDLTNQLLNSNIGEAMHGLGMRPLPSIPEYGPNASKGTNGRPISSASAIDLMMNPQHAAEFDQAFGAGSAQQILGGTPTGGSPFKPAGQ